MKPIINVTPLIDVLLVLLIIFMVITPAKPSAFKAKIPAEPTGQPNLRQNPNYLVVIVNNDESLTLNLEQDVASVSQPEKITEKLREVFEYRSANGILNTESNEIEKTVFIKAPRNLKYGSVANVVDAVKLAGASPIGLQIDQLD